MVLCTFDTCIHVIISKFPREDQTLKLTLAPFNQCEEDGMVELNMIAAENNPTV